MKPTSSPQGWLKLSFVIDDYTSLHDMLATLKLGDEVIEQFRMDWSHPPYDHKVRTGLTYFRIIDLLREYGRLIIKER